MARTVIVTGGCGYIGSHVSRAFKMNGDNVYIIDLVKRDHTLKDIDGYFIADFASDEGLSTIVDLAPDVIVHCAGTSLVGPSMTNPSEYYNNNIVKTIRMMDVIKDLPKLPSILFSSSASVYGNPLSSPVHETAEVRPISPYGSTKATDELIFKDYSNAYGINTMCFRYFNAAGAAPSTFDLGQEPGATHIIARVLEAAINKTEFKLFGTDYNTSDGSCVRDYIHVWDLAIAHLRGADYIDRIHSKDAVTAGSYVFNLGTKEGVSNWDIVKYVTLKYNLETLTVDVRRPGDPDVLIADATNAMNHLGWTPQFSNLETIVDSAYKWYTRNDTTTTS